MRRADVLKYWLPALAWSAVLILLSGNAGSSGITERILGAFFPVSSPVFDIIHYILRKTIHVLAYGLLGALDFRAVRGRNHGWTLRWSVTAVALAVAVAALDELHQSTVASRTGQFTDVIIDCAGATLAQLAIHGANNRSDQPAR